MLYRDTFSRCPLIWGSIFKTANFFWNILGSAYWLQSIWKNHTRNFCFLFISKVTTTKINFRFYKQCSQGAAGLICEGVILRKLLVSFFSSNIPLCNKKNPVENLCKVLEMQLKTYTTACPKLVFEKIKFKVLQDVQHDLICQRLRLSKDQTIMFKSFVIK